MLSQNSTLTHTDRSLSMSQLLLPKDSLAAFSPDSMLLAYAGAGERHLRYRDRRWQTQKQIQTAEISALCSRPNDKQYQRLAPANEIPRNELLIASKRSNQIQRYLPSLGAFVTAVTVKEPTALTCTGTGQWMAVGNSSGELLLFDLTAREAIPFFGTRICQGPITKIVCGADGEHLFILGQNKRAYLLRLNVEYIAGEDYLQPGGSVYLQIRLKPNRARAKEIIAIASVLPQQVTGINVHPTVRQVALTTPSNRIYFWNYACCTVSYFDCPLAGPLVAYFCNTTDHLLVDSPEGLAVYDLHKRQKRPTSSTTGGGAYPLQYELLLSAPGRPTIFPNVQQGRMIRSIADSKGTCIVACS